MKLSAILAILSVVATTAFALPLTNGEHDIPTAGNEPISDLDEPQQQNQGGSDSSAYAYAIANSVSHTFSAFGISVSDSAN